MISQLHIQCSNYYAAKHINANKTPLPQLTILCLHHTAWQNILSVFDDITKSCI